MSSAPPRAGATTAAAVGSTRDCTLGARLGRVARGQPGDIHGLFRGKLLAAITRARECGQLEFDAVCANLADPAAFARWKDALYKKDYCFCSALYWEALLARARR